MVEVIAKVYEFNKAAGLLDEGYSDYRENSFQVEEALEGFDYSNVLPPESYVTAITAKDVARDIMFLADADNIVLSDVARLDKACDAIIFAIGSMAKLGLSPDQINRSLLVVTTANEAKVGCKKDSHGKLVKPDNFKEYAPEKLLEKILKER